MIEYDFQIFKYYNWETNSYFFIPYADVRKNNYPIGIWIVNNSYLQNKFRLNIKLNDIIDKFNSKDISGDLGFFSEQDARDFIKFFKTIIKNKGMR